MIEWNTIHEGLAYIMGPRRHASLWRRNKDDGEGDLYTIELSENVTNFDELYIKGATELRDDLNDLFACVPNDKRDGRL